MRELIAAAVVGVIEHERAARAQRQSRRGTCQDQRARCCRRIGRRRPDIDDAERTAVGGDRGANRAHCGAVRNREHAIAESANGEGARVRPCRAGPIDGNRPPTVRGGTDKAGDIRDRPIVRDVERASARRSHRQIVGIVPLRARAGDRHEANAGWIIADIPKPVGNDCAVGDAERAVARIAHT